MNLLKSAIAGAASAVGAHYADQAINPVPHTPTVYYGVAVGGLIGAFFLRNKSPIGAGLLFGLGAGSAYQGYTRNVPRHVTAPRPVSAPIYAPASYQPPPASRPAFTPPAPAGSPFSASQLQDLYKQSQQYAGQLETQFTPTEQSVPYSSDDYDADTADWSEES